MLRNKNATKVGYLNGAVVPHLRTFASQKYVGQHVLLPQHGSTRQNVRAGSVRVYDTAHTVAQHLTTENMGTNDARHNISKRQTQI